METEKICAIPAGMRDWLPEEAYLKRDITNELLNKIALWGYAEIMTPVLEYYQVLTKVEEESGPDHLYKLIDRDGSILALRPEMTTPIARIAGGKLQGKPPWRLMYGAQVFRYENIQAGRQREFNQVGVELIGQKGPEADCEVLALAIAALKSIGLENFTVSLGHMGVLKGLLESLSWEDKDLAKVRSLVLEKDFVGLRHFFEKAGLESKRQEQLLELLTQPIAVSDITQLMSGLPACLRTALAELQEILALLDNYGYSSYIQLDLSTLRSQTYYTGMVFEIYTAGIGYPIGGGGRYDKLLRRFGRDYPATGFALGIERLLMSLPKKEKPAKPVLLTADGLGASKARMVEEAGLLRINGQTVVLEFRAMNKAQAQELARDKNAELIWFSEVKKCGE